MRSCWRDSSAVFFFCLKFQKKGLENLHGLYVKQAYSSFKRADVPAQQNSLCKSCIIVLMGFIMLIKSWRHEISRRR